MIGNQGNLNSCTLESRKVITSKVNDVELGDKATRVNDYGDVSAVIMTLLLNFVVFSVIKKTLTLNTVQKHC